jgi:hypothetical protein
VKIISCMRMWHVTEVAKLWEKEMVGYDNGEVLYAGSNGGTALRRTPPLEPLGNR